MAITVLPIDASSGSPAYTAQQTRQAFSALMGLAPASRQVGAWSGVRPGTPNTTVYLSGTGSMTWNVGAHSGVLDTEASAIAGPYLYACDGTDSGTVTAADATYGRVDIVYVQVDDTVQDGSGQRKGVVGYLAGTPASSPSAPATPLRALVLAQISVPKSGGGSPTVSWAAAVWGAMASVRLSKSGTQSIASGSWVSIVFGSESADPYGMGAPAAGTITAPFGGWYLLQGQLSYDGTTTGGYAGRLTQNGNAVAQAGGAFTGNATFDAANMAALVNATAGDVFAMSTQQNTGSAQTIDAGIGAGVWFQATWIGAH